MHSTVRTFWVPAIAAALFSPCLLSAQGTSTAPGKDSTAAKATAPASPQIDFSGILFANFQYRGEKGPTHASNKFDVERAYLTFRMPAGDRTSVRVTADLFQQTTPGSDSYYRGWVLRAKYAYLQYNYLNSTDWKGLARVGLLHTVLIDHDEQFWPRWISTTPTERAGYFSSADAGIATSISLPRKFGEVYATVTNGPGYTSRETDRFKDYAARLTVTPWASESDNLLKPVALSAWYYRGAVGSKFVATTPGEVGPIGSGLDRNRWGVHAAENDPRLTLGVQYARRQEQGESGLNTAASPRNVIDSTGNLWSGYAIARPFALADKASTSPLSLVFRFDRVTTNIDKGSKYNVVIGGLIWDLSKRASVSADYQETTPVTGAPIAPVKTYYAHFVARF
ncbi:MAG: hypothetical protein ABJC63_06035 [Gemmatimonadales bacterium]